MSVQAHTHTTVTSTQRILVFPIFSKKNNKIVDFGRKTTSSNIFPSFPNFCPFLSFSMGIFTDPALKAQLDTAESVFPTEDVKFNCESAQLDLR